MERWGGGNGRRRRTNARPLMVFMAALTGQFNSQIKGEITSGGGGVMEHVTLKRGKAGHGGLGVAAAHAWRCPASTGGRRRGRGLLGLSGL
jgi:hypothetical protein